MLLCFRCSAETKERLDALVGTGAYKDHGQAIAVAVENLAVLEREVGTKGELVLRSGGKIPIDRRKLPRTSPGKGTDRADSHASSSSLAARMLSEPRPRAPSATKPEPRTHSDGSIPLMFRRDALPEKEPRGLAGLPPDLWARGHDVPLDRWIFGQFNRLLPAKANARALIYLFVHNKGALGITEATDALAAEAMELGAVLAALDAERNTPRDEALATAFPQARKDPEKARQRYANQFVVYENSMGELSGLMVDLKLINVVNRGRKGRIVPTQTAWRFATLENPVLDHAANDGVSKFSEEERAFLVDHILNDVPAEAFAYKVILEAVKQGADTPERIDAALKALVSAERADQLSESFLASQRSGAISRMSDLRLVERIRRGIHVQYGVTEAGEQLLSRF